MPSEYVVQELHSTIPVLLLGLFLSSLTMGCLSRWSNCWGAMLQNVMLLLGTFVIFTNFKQHSVDSNGFLNLIARASVGQVGKILTCPSVGWYHRVTNNDADGQQRIFHVLG